MQQTTNYNLNKFDSTDELESATRVGLNENADTIDTALKGIQDVIDGLDASDVPYDNTVSGLTATDVQAALDEELDKIDILSNSVDTERLRYPDLTKQLHSITTIGASYTATKYCWAIGYTRGQGGSSSIVTVNGVEIAVGASDGYGVSTVLFPLRPNDTLATRNLTGIYNIIIYDTV